MRASSTRLPIKIGFIMCIMQDASVDASEDANQPRRSHMGWANVESIDGQGSPTTLHAPVRGAG